MLIISKTNALFLQKPLNEAARITQYLNLSIIHLTKQITPDIANETTEQQTNENKYATKIFFTLM